MSASARFRIVIADDHPIFRRGLCEVIAAHHDLSLVGQAGDGAEALRVIAECQPDVAILDLKMPKLTGLQVVQNLSEKMETVKVILLTMHEDEELLNAALNLCIPGYVLKENAVEDLLAAIQTVTQGGTFVSALLTGMLLRRRNGFERLRREKPAFELLTPTELRVLKLIADDKTSKEIAVRFSCAVRTVETHRQNISTKLGLSGSHSLLKFAYDNKSRF